MRFKVGDKLVYPFYGAGVVTEITECEILGELREYYVLEFSDNRLKLNIPTDKAEESGLRELIPASRVPEVYEHFKTEVTLEGGTWSKRNKLSMDKLRSGDIMEAVEVYKYLRVRENVRPLSTGESKIMRGVHNSIVSELSFVTGEPAEVIETKINGIFEELSSANR